jgi:hypothetical protein
VTQTDVPPAADGEAFWDPELPPRRAAPAAVFGRAMSGMLARRQYRVAGRFVLRGLAAPGQTIRWMTFLGWLERAARGVALPDELARKPGRDFLSLGFGQEARTGLLIDHYRTLSRRLSGALFRKLLRGEPQWLGEITARSGEGYVLTLGQSPLCDREGELTIAVAPASTGEPLARLSFLVGGVNGETALVIGGLQGGLKGRERVVQATRDLWGLRPKALVVEAAYGIARHLGVTAIFAVSNAGHVLRGHGAGGKSIAADYDAFWTELGGAPAGPHLFRLPGRLTERVEADVPAAKRRLWRQRRMAVMTLRISLDGALAPHLAADPADLT